MNLYLIGPRGCGKSTVGHMLAESLGCPWIDLDHRIQELSGKSIAEIFAGQGQGHFRELESKTLASLAEETASQPHVVSLGGGAVLRPENRRIIEASGITVLLIAAPQVLAQRLQSDPQTVTLRPTLADSGESAWTLLEETEHMLSLRLPTYQQCANLKLDTSDFSATEVTQQILRWLSRAKKSPFAEVAKGSES